MKIKENIAEEAQKMKNDIGEVFQTIKNHKGKILGAIAGLSIFGAVADHRNEENINKVRQEQAEAMARGEIGTTIEEVMKFREGNKDKTDE